MLKRLVFIFKLIFILCFLLFQAQGQDIAGILTETSFKGKESSLEVFLEDDLMFKRDTIADISAGYNSFSGEKKSIQELVRENLKIVMQTCFVKGGFYEKLVYLSSSLKLFQGFLNEYLINSNLTSKDHLFLMSVHSSMPDQSLYKKIQFVSESVLQNQILKIRRDFERSYRLLYLLPDDVTPSNFPDVWAAEIYKSIKCVGMSS